MFRSLSNLDLAIGARPFVGTRGFANRTAVFLTRGSVFCALVLLPLVVYLYVDRDLTPMLRSIFGADRLYDVAFFGKEIVSVGLGILALAGCLVGWITRALPLPRPTALVLGLALTCLFTASTVLSPNANVAWLGAPTIYDGGALYLSYVALFFAASSIGLNGLGRRAWFLGLASLVVVIAFLGYFDYFKTPLLKSATASRWLGADRLGLEIVTEDGRAGIFATLGNRNYVGTFMAMTWPVLAIGALTARSKKMALFLTATSLLAALVLLCSFSRSGYVGAAAGFGVAFLLVFGKLLQRPGRFLGFVAVHAALVFAPLDVKDRESVGNRLSLAISTVAPRALISDESAPGDAPKSPASAAAPDATAPSQPTAPSVAVAVADPRTSTPPSEPATTTPDSSVKPSDATAASSAAVDGSPATSFGVPPTDASSAPSSTSLANPPVSVEPLRSGSIAEIDGRLHLNLSSTPLLIERQAGAVKLTDENHQALPIEVHGAKYLINDPRYAGYDITVAEAAGIPLLQINHGGRRFDVAITNAGFRLLDGNRLVKPIIGRTFDLPLADHALNHRGFIWKRTVPLIQDRPLLGQGPGTFPIAYPNQDVYATIANFHNSGMIVDKPHSFYFQIAYSFGVPALLILLLLIGRGLVNAGVAAVRSRDPGEAGSYAALVAALIGFAIAGAVNDGVAGVAQIFWILLGFALAAKPAEFVQA